MLGKLILLTRKYSDAARFLCVGVTASLVHGAISWIFYYHIFCGYTVLSTLVGYSGGWVVSYIGNRLWSFREQAKHTGVRSTAAKFIVSQLAAMCVLLSSTWLLQQCLMLYFWWYMITNHIEETPELLRFSVGASYPPALLAGMVLAAVCSYLIMKVYVFRNSKRPRYDY